MANTKALVIQSGGSTPVLNRSLYGIASEVGQSQVLTGLTGAMHGLEGLLSRDLVDLTNQSESWWYRTAHTPGAILGSTRKRLELKDVPDVIKVLSEYSIGYLFIIGGNDSAETGHRIALAAKSEGITLQVINVPKTIDNDLVLTDHSPGYGSAARFLSLATMGIGRDAETMGHASPVTIMEVMGRNAGWLAAATAMSKRDEVDAPHLICVPEVPINETRFLDIIENSYKRYGFAVAVVAENTRDTHGVIGGQKKPSFVDDFGHAYYDGPARYLSMVTSKRLNVRVRHEKPGTIQRSMATCVSRSDAQEAEEVGRAAVRHALTGHSDMMVTLVRDSNKPYVCTTGVSALKDVAGMEKTIPSEYYNSSEYMVTPAFINYATPLIGTPLPHFSRI